MSCRSASGGDDVGPAGRLAELLWRLGELADQAAVERPVGEWLASVRDLVELCCSVDRDDEWQLESLWRELAAIEAGSGAPDHRDRVPLSFLDLRRLLADHLADAAGRPDFFRGGVTVSSMAPLRGVPYRVIVLVGVDQPAFAVGAPDGDDLAAAIPLIGDRDRRGESRQSLLEAVLAARERLVIIRDGHDVRTNHVVPPAVPVAELTDALCAMIEPDRRPGFRRNLELHHPRQPFAEAVFTPGGLIGQGSWGFDRAAYEGAVARRARVHGRHDFLSAPFPANDEPVIELSELHAFLKEPVPYFVRRRLGLRLPSRAEAPDPHLPLALAPLDKWSLGNRLLEWVLDGGSVEQWQLVEVRRGTLGPGVLGQATLAEVTGSVARVGADRGRSGRSARPRGAAPRRRPTR